MNIPSPTLLGQDLVPRFPPRLKSGINIADLHSGRRRHLQGSAAVGQPGAIYHHPVVQYPGDVSMPPPGVPALGIFQPRLPPPLGVGSLQIPFNCESGGPVSYQAPQQQQPQYQGWVPPHQQQQHHMFAPTGARQWGSMEPTPKRPNVQQYQQLQPPFSFSQNSLNVPPPPPQSEGYGSIPRPPGQQVMPTPGMPRYVPMATPGNRTLTLEHLRNRLSDTLRQKDPSSN